MKITVEFLGFPTVTDVIGEKKIALPVADGTVAEVIQGMIDRYGGKIREAFYGREGRFDPMIQIVINGRTFVSPQRHGAPLLKEGDTLTMMLLLAGG